MSIPFLIRFSSLCPRSAERSANGLGNKILTLIQSENKIPYLIGDFNINLLNVDKYAPTAEFIELMYRAYIFLFPTD